MRRKANPMSPDAWLLLALVGMMGYVAWQVSKVPWETVKGLPWDQIKILGSKVERINQLLS